MGTQILTGTVGNYKPKNPGVFGDTSFVVTRDTCLEAEKLPVKFKDATVGCWLFMRDVSFNPSTIKTKDY